MKIETAMRTLLRKYEEAKGSKWIEDPVAWALYHTWREADSDRAKRKEKGNNGHRKSTSDDTNDKDS